MRIPGVKTARTVSRCLQARLWGGALILGYHRIAPAAEDVYESCVSPEHFGEHLEVLNRHARPVCMSKLVQQLKAGSLPPKSVAVTFDDGYADNLYQARPLLEKYDIPATVFVCTRDLGAEFWWDELERLVLLSTADLDALHSRMRKNHFPWEPPKVRHDASPSFRDQVRHSLYHFLLTLDVEDQQRAMQVICEWAGLSPEVRSAYRTMRPAELLQLVDGGLVNLGAHTRNHPMLPHLSVQRQREEIVSGKQDLEALLGRQVDGFSYPNGRATADARQIVYEAGFAYACTSLQDVVRPGSDLYALTRFWQKDVDGDKFLHALKLWMSR